MTRGSAIMRGTALRREYTERRGEGGLSPREIEALRAYALEGDQAAAAAVLGISVQTTKNHLASSYFKLDVSSAFQAFRKLGWLRVPNDPSPELASLAMAERSRAAIARLEAIRDELIDLLTAPGSDAAPSDSPVTRPGGALSVAGDGVAVTPEPSLRRVV